jgi:hypothetical protein
MNHIFRIDVLQSADQLIRNHQHRFKREMTAAIIEKVFQTGFEKLKYHDTILAFPSKSVDRRYFSISGQRFVYLDFLSKE